MNEETEMEGVVLGVRGRFVDFGEGAPRVRLVVDVRVEMGEAAYWMAPVVLAPCEGRRGTALYDLLRLAGLLVEFEDAFPGVYSWEGRQELEELASWLNAELSRAAVTVRTRAKSGQRQRVVEVLDIRRGPTRVWRAERDGLQLSVQQGAGLAVEILNESGEFVRVLPDQLGTLRSLLCQLEQDVTCRADLQAGSWH